MHLQQQSSSNKGDETHPKVFGDNGYPTKFIRRAMNPKPTTDGTQEVVANYREVSKIQTSYRIIAAAGKLCFTGQLE